LSSGLCGDVSCATNKLSLFLGIWCMSTIRRICNFQSCQARLCVLGDERLYVPRLQIHVLWIKTGCDSVLLGLQLIPSLRRFSALMVFPLLFPVLALVGRIRAAPIDQYRGESYSAERPSGSTCSDIDHCRTLEDLVVSCLTTIFACTYLSYHSDVPDPTCTERRRRAIRICSMVISILIPELTVAKAASQWRQVQEYKSPFQGR